MVNVDDENGDNDGEGDEDHDEEQVFSNQWNDLATRQLWSGYWINAESV